MLRRALRRPSLVLPRFPQPGEGVHVYDEQWRAGGNAFNEARALADWGLRVALMGDTLGHDQAGDLLAAVLAVLPLDTGFLMRSMKARTPVCHILRTPDGERTILATRDSDPPFHPPSQALLQRCRLVSVTRYGPHTAAVARSASAARCTVLVGDATRPDDDWAPWADVIVTSAALLRAHTPDVPIATQIVDLHRLRGATVIVTDGPRAVRALWNVDGKMTHNSVLPPPIQVADSTGAGDVFRAAVGRAIVQGTSWPQTIADATAAAAAFCSSIDHR
ncbi:carbohydrate kinase family protein [Candidatus Gracilibacteria bacterium]|nr:carbohydrate kinase family protein [Candidatus Gracilibacteria bacterium]